MLALGLSLLGCWAVNGALGAEPPEHASHSPLTGRSLSPNRPASPHGPLSPNRSPAHDPQGHAKTPPAEVTLPSSPPSSGIPVTMAPAGLSLEYPTMAQDLGAGPCPPPALVAQLQALGSPPISLAGDSQDMTAPSGAPAPVSWETATLYSLPATFWSQLHCLLSAAHDPLTVGLNAKTGEPAWSAQMVSGAQSAVAGIQSAATTATSSLDFSLGNEPDLYGVPNYASLSRPVPNEEAVAVNTYLQVASSVQQSLAGAPVIGPELARPSHWQRELPRVIAALHMQTVGVHMYPLSACATPKAVTIKNLLSAKAANDPGSLQWVVADAQAAHVPAIISEANSASCGGVAGVSNSPASAVWAVRFVLSALKTGFQEVRFHFSNAPYDPFVVRGESVLAQPLDSALVALNQWLPVGATLRTLTGVRGLQASSIFVPAIAPGSPTTPTSLTSSASPTTPSPASSSSASPAASTAASSAASPGQSTTSATPPAPSSGTTTVILDNEHTRAQQVVLRGAHAVRVQTLTPLHADLSTSTASARSTRGIRLTVPANSVVAVTPTP